MWVGDIGIRYEEDSQIESVIMDWIGKDEGM